MICAYKKILLQMKS